MSNHIKTIYYNRPPQQNTHLTPTEDAKKVRKSSYIDRKFYSEKKKLTHNPKIKKNKHEKPRCVCSSLVPSSEEA